MMEMRIGMQDSTLCNLASSRCCQADSDFDLDLDCADVRKKRIAARRLTPLDNVSPISYYPILNILSGLLHMHTERQLNPDPRGTPETSLLPVWRRIHQAMGMRLSRHGVPLSLAVALLHIHTRDEPAEPTRLADQILLPRQTITFILDALERKGLAHRRPHPVDRRRKVIVLTPRGRQKAQTILDDLVSYETEAARLTFAPPEADVFRQTVVRLADVLEQLNTPDTRS
jgi:DNA-binding MarR family transcriptional regulator